MENRNKPAFATSSPSCAKYDGHLQEGLTKREYFAAMAMQGLITHYGCNDLTNLGERSIECADALLYGLDKTK